MILKELLRYIGKLGYTNIECLEDLDEGYYSLSVINDRTELKIYSITKIEEGCSNNDVYYSEVEYIFIQHPYICYPDESAIGEIGIGEDVFGFIFTTEHENLTFENISRAIWIIGHPLETELEVTNYHLENIQILVYNYKTILTQKFGFIPFSTNILASVGAKYSVGFCEDDPPLTINFCHTNERNRIYLSFETDILTGDLKGNKDVFPGVKDIKILSEKEFEEYIEKWMWNNGSPQLEFEYYFEERSDPKYTIESYPEIVKLMRKEDGVDYTKIPDKYMNLAWGK